MKEISEREGTGDVELGLVHCRTMVFRAAVYLCAAFV